MIKRLSLTAIISASWYFIGSIWLVFIVSCNLRLLISDTDSLAQHYFIQVQRLSPKLNNYTTVWSNWYQGLMIKKIIGVAGDKICCHDDKLFVNEGAIGSLQPTATDGRVLHPIKSQIIPAGYVFLAGTHPRSFDSRYEELGLIPVGALQGLVFPLF